jgi:hypothetical protein
VGIRSGGGWPREVVDDPEILVMAGSGGCDTQCRSDSS